MIRLLRFFPRRWWSVGAWRSWREYIHWRMETFGVYFPDGKTNASALRTLLRQFPSYFRWLAQIDKARRR